MQGAGAPLQWVAREVAVPFERCEDVYKRQLLAHRQVCRLLSRTAHWFGFGPQDTWTLFPVSYTHLDVYKRQGVDRSAQGRGQPAFGPGQPTGVDAAGV